MIRSLLVLMVVGLVGGFAHAQDRGEGSPPSKTCWGQATRVFAQTGEMGEHASQQPTPRLGLRNLARALYDAGVLDDDSMAALGAFVADELGLGIDACTLD